MAGDRPALPTRLVDTGVVAIVRAPAMARVTAAVETLVRAGITCVELTLTMPDAVAGIESLRKEFGDDASVGAGTVLTADQARACIDAGAAFLVAPSTVPEVVRVAVAAGVPCLPGALTPSEILEAWESGASAVKLFPASVGGARYLRDIRAPLPDIAIVPTGGVGIDDVEDYIAAGAVAVGLGGPLFGDSLTGGDLEALARRATTLLGAVARARALARGPLA
jgi:2-dehydro-3-deoxyphosphogluconate aldolase / (4S)-4-hydroxy-2-oxoglutarate aldolase